MTTLDRRAVTARSSGFSPLAALGAVAVALGFAAAGERPALAAGVALALAALVLAPPYWFALGQIAALAALSEPTGASLAAVEGSLLFGLAAATAAESSVRSALALLVAVGLLLALGGGVYLLRGSLWPAAAVLCGALALATYGLYRYGLVRLGLVGGEP